MANSGQNFLDLLFGGVDKGINQFRQQRGQQTDLALTIQQMLQRQKESDRDYGLKKSAADLRATAIGQLPEQLRPYAGAGITPASGIQEQAAGIPQKGTLPAAFIQEYNIYKSQMGEKALPIGEYYTSTRKGGDDLLSAGSLARFAADYQKIVGDHEQKQMIYSLLRDKVPGLAEPTAPPGTFGEYLQGILDAARNTGSDEELAKMLREVVGQ